MTMYFGIWNQSFGDYALTNFSTTGAIINSCFFSFFWVMMIWSHLEAVRTKAGYMPFDKETLTEELIPENSQFYDVIREREDIFHEYIVRKKIKSGALPSYD